MLFFNSCNTILIHKNAYSKYCWHYKNMAIKELKDFLHEKYFRRIQLLLNETSETK